MQTLTAKHDITQSIPFLEDLLHGKQNTLLYNVLYSRIRRMDDRCTATSPTRRSVAKSNAPKLSIIHQFKHARWLNRRTQNTSPRTFTAHHAQAAPNCQNCPPQNWPQRLQSGNPIPNPPCPAGPIIPTSCLNPQGTRKCNRTNRQTAWWPAECRRLLNIEKLCVF